ncbi:SgcJ/EcaC family oxidoreductase [Mesorhizobium sp. M0895]|uniref:SgcJ/EcaC family oxidoreductase n=1 Tax=Mesorhizobium sp. M0895 TaxID=2957019 RepID=UPI0033384132
MDEFASLFASDANFVNVVGVWWKNRSEIEAAHRATHDTMFRDSRLEGDISSVVELAPGLASVHYTWTLTGAFAPDGSPAGVRKGILLPDCPRRAVGMANQGGSEHGYCSRRNRPSRLERLARVNQRRNRASASEPDHQYVCVPECRIRLV